MINKEALYFASRDLKENVKSQGAFLLWLYFASNQVGFSTAVGSSCDCCTKMGLKKLSYEAAFKDLIDKGYLVETSSNHYTFYESPIRNDCNENR